MSTYSPKTDCVHSGTIVDPRTWGAVSPVYPATSNGYLDTDENIYPRYFNLPNQKALEEKLATLEKGEAGIVFSSGMAAISTILLTNLQKGDHAVFQTGLYGGTTKFVQSTFERHGIEYSFTEGTGLSHFEQAVKPNTKVIYVESPSNPLLGIVDLAGISDLARSKGITTITDNTFASPINQNPLELGIDIVVHSATKYLGGHSDICAGVAISKRIPIEQARAMARNLGGSLNATTCALLERSLKTLAVRVEQQNRNAQKIAEFLNEHPQIQKVYYPGLPDHSGHETAAKQMRAFGGVVSFELVERLDSRSFQKNLRLILPSLSLGGVETTICSPALTSHADLTAQQRVGIGIKETLLRLSVGIEEVTDLIADLDLALTKTAQVRSGHKPVKPALVAVHF